MKMKKMLAILAALSVLGTTGLTVGAEDTATTTEPATEAITTTETEAETTAVETTAETETTVETDVTEETAATEENQVVKMEDASNEITIDGVSFTVKVSVASDSSVVLSVLKDGNVTNLNNICVESKVSGELQVGNYYSVDSNNRLTIYAVDGNHNYIWSNEYNVFVASTLNEEGENLEIIDASTFQMNGKTVKITLWRYKNELFDELSRISVYVDGKLTNLSGIVVNTSLFGQTSPGNIYQRSVHQYFSVSDNVLTIKPDSAYGETASYTFDNASGQFVTAGGAQTTTTTTENTTTTTTTTTTEATNAIVDQKTETMIVQGKPYTLRFVLFKSTYSYGYCISIYVDGKLVISDQPVGYFEYNPTSVSSYAGVSRDSVSEVTVTDWGESTTTPTTTSFHYQYDPSQGVFVAVVRSDEDSETTSTKEALYNKFVAAYGKPTYTNYGDFDQDGELDAYFVYYDSTGVNTYFVTKDGITLVDKNTGDSMWSSDFAYFTCNGYRFRANLHTRIPVAYATGYITIERIEADGSLTKVNFNETVLQDSFAVDHNPNYTADLREDLANKVSSYFSCNGDKITVTHYLYENGRDVGSNSYVYDEATNSFVKAGNTTPDDDNNQQKPLEIHLGDTMTVTGTLHYELETAYENNHKQVVLKLDKPITVTYMDEMENGFGSVKAGMTEVVDSVQISLDDKLPEGTHLTVTGNVMYGHTGHHIRHIVLLDCTYQLDGKTDNGSASNAPASTATKNTSGTPKTGDVTTVPAVAVGLTLTAAGVVAFISKKKK